MFSTRVRVSIPMQIKTKPEKVNLFQFHRTKYEMKNNEKYSDQKRSVQSMSPACSRSHCSYGQGHLQDSALTGKTLSSFSIHWHNSSINTCINYTPSDTAFWERYRNHQWFSGQVEIYTSHILIGRGPGRFVTSQLWVAFMGNGMVHVKKQSLCQWGKSMRIVYRM